MAHGSIPTPSLQTGGANGDRTLSAQGQAAVSQREGQTVGGGYYNDSAKNCTYGVGLLAHLGPCTSDELRRTVNPQQAQREFQGRVNEAAQRVRALVPDRRLTQNQFDALVSAVFNTRLQDNAPFLFHANRGDDDAVIRDLRALVYTHDHDAHGRSIGRKVYSRGLGNRRESEIQQYGRSSQ